MTVSTIASYNVIDYLDPPVTEDDHRYMPTENIAKSLFLGSVVGSVVFITAVRIQRRKLRK